MGDDTILDLFWKRSEKALAKCDRRYGRYCQTIAYNILKSREDAEECVNETWLKAWCAIPPAKPTSLKSFLGRICRNTALDRYEAAHARKRGGGVLDATFHEISDLAAPEAMDAGEIAHAINAFLHEEPPELSDIFVKRYWYFLSVKEIAEEYRYSTGKVASILFRMRQKLKSTLESRDLI